MLHDLMASVAGAGVPAATGPALFTGAIPAVLGCAYPVALLIALNLRQVRDYYAVGQGGPPGAPAA